MFIEVVSVLCAIKFNFKMCDWLNEVGWQQHRAAVCILRYWPILLYYFVTSRLPVLILLWPKTSSTVWKSWHLTERRSFVRYTSRRLKYTPCSTGDSYMSCLTGDDDSTNNVFQLNFRVGVPINCIDNELLALYLYVEKLKVHWNIVNFSFDFTR